MVSSTVTLPVARSRWRGLRAMNSPQRRPVLIAVSTISRCWAGAGPMAREKGIGLVPKKVWTPALDADGGIREGGDNAELTGLLDLSTWPPGMRVIVRRERPHPGAQLSLFEERDGWRYQAFVTNTTVGQLASLEARHRAHARVEDRIRHAKDSGLGRFPSREFDINQTWLGQRPRGRCPSKV